ncbi:MAG TPA: hypothetical protein VMH89_06755 [Candidatus Acidoferrum sp.]|nr:hypothetical protein [Candidatus Acidoferrum sp.]
MRVLFSTIGSRGVVRPAVALGVAQMTEATAATQFETLTSALLPRKSAK